MTRLRGLAAFVALAAFVVGVPWLLVTYGQSPVSGWAPIGDASDIANTVVSDTMVFGVLTVGAWAVWALFTLSVIVEGVAAARNAPAPRVAFAGTLQRTARALVASIVLAVSLSHGHQSAFAAGPRTHLPMPSRAATLVVEVPEHRAVERVAPLNAEVSSSNESETADGQRMITVARGDSAWALAEDHLDDGLRWRELWELNRDRPQPDGGAWTDPQVIRPGWQLVLPDTGPTPQESPVSAAATPTTHLVVHGDTLSGIAAAHLGDAGRYREIFELNRDRPQPDGRRLTDPNLIVVGWELMLPADGSIATAPPPAPAPPPPPSEQPTSSADTMEPSVPLPSMTEVDGTPGQNIDAPATPPPTTTVPANTPPTMAETPATTTPSLADRAAPVEPSAAVEAADADGESWWAANAPVLAGVSGATVLASGLLLRLRHSRRRQRFGGAAAVSAQPTVAELAVVAAADVPLVRWAGQELATMLARIEPRDAVRSVPVAVELSPEAGIEVLWETPNPTAPAPWVAADEGWAWRLPYDPDAELPIDALPAAMPALATVGTRDGRQLMVDLETFGTVAVTGDERRVDDFLRAVAIELSSGDDLADAYVLAVGIDDLAPSERLVEMELDAAITRATAFSDSIAAALDRAGRASAFAYRAGPGGAHIEANVVVLAAGLAGPYLGQPVRQRSGIAIVTGSELPDAKARIEVASDGSASIQPLGISFVAAGVPAESGQLVADLTSDPTANDSDPSMNGDGDPRANGHRAARLNRHATHAIQPGPVAMPWLDGEPLTLFELPGIARDDDTDQPPPSPSPLDALMVIKVLGTPRVPDRPDLKRRELILTVFLACRGGLVNSSAVLDALWGGRAVQGKTVWNLVGRTRSALGLLPDGTEVMLPADRTMRMKGLSPAVTTDLAILRHLYEQAQTISSSESIELLRQGLALVEGPPFDAEGYDWAHHGTQDVAEAERLIEQSAEQLVNLALDNDDIDTAREAVSHGLRGLPGDEVLYRLRMKVEHHAGNLTGVSAAFDELSRHLAEFDTDPSPSTLDLQRDLLGERTAARTRR